MAITPARKRHNVAKGIMKRLLTYIISGLLATSISAQVTLQDIEQTPGKAGGVYYAYPGPASKLTPAPKGYEPFYISHYGRHGSRFLISDNDYLRVINRLQHARQHNALTPQGLEVLNRLDTVWAEAQGRGGELTPLGARQHHDIARRMYDNNTQAFKGNPEITAKSTTVMRCAHSMFAFIEGLKEQNPSLVIPRESGQRAMSYLNYHAPEAGPYSDHRGEWYQDWRKFRHEKTNPDRLMSTLFSDSLYVRRWVDPEETMWDLYWVAVDMQNMEASTDFFYLFTPQELFDLWQVFNFNFFACNSSYPPAKGLHVDNAKNLVRNIRDTARYYIANNKNGATLRFGHDGNIIPLAAALRIPGAWTNESDPHKLHLSYADFKISPMASNLQIVFYKNKAGNILVKFMLNEHEVALPIPTQTAPYYSWENVDAFLTEVIETPFANFSAKQ